MFIDNFLNLLSRIPNFSTFKAHRNKTTDQNLFKPFLTDRGDQSIKSQEVLHYKFSPSVNNITKTKGKGKSAPLPASNRVNFVSGMDCERNLNRYFFHFFLFLGCQFWSWVLYLGGPSNHHFRTL